MDISELFNKLTPLEMFELIYKLEKALNKSGLIYDEKVNRTYSKFFVSNLTAHFDSRQEGNNQIVKTTSKKLRQ